MDILAHHFKHVQSSAEKIPPHRSGIPIGHALGFDETGENMDVRNIYFVIRDSVRFVHKKAVQNTTNWDERAQEALPTY